MEERFLTGFIEYLLKSQEFKTVLKNYINTKQDDVSLQIDEADSSYDPRYKKCAYDKCDKVFIPTRSDKAHCSDRCRYANNASQGKRKWNKETKKWEKI